MAAFLLPLRRLKMPGKGKKELPLSSHVVTNFRFVTCSVQRISGRESRIALKMWKFLSFEYRSVLRSASSVEAAAVGNGAEMAEVRKCKARPLPD